MLRKSSFFIILFLLFSLVLPVGVLAQAELYKGFNPNYIISDYEMADYNSMSYDNIHSFLRKKGSLNELIL
ncbi:MAG: hypothetical protein V1692_02500, partial [bacterium]